MTSFVRYLDNGSIEIRAPYNPEFITALKVAIPWDCRAWVPDAKFWAIKAIYANQAIQIVKTFYDPVEIHRDNRNTQSPPTSAPIGDPFRVLHLLPTAPSQVIQAAYKAMARLHHPDAGGDTKSMQQINAAYEKLKDRIA